MRRRGWGPPPEVTITHNRQPGGTFSREGTMRHLQSYYASLIVEMERLNAEFQAVGGRR